jgi:hypothetical protein
MTAPHYGKRNLGSGTAASPGDTLYFFFGTYNDSGNSEADTGLSVTDIEVYKDNGTTPRLTDSGYSLIVDTGTPGLRRFRVQLFNTADDASFYANGSWYQVAVDNVKIDGKLVRFWAGSFEIGEPRANVVSFADTGVNQRLAQIQSDVDTGLRVHITDADTGIHDAIADLDTGIRALLALRDTGAIATAVWAGDTGLRDHITNVDTGLTARLSGVISANVTQIRGDTGGADRFFRYTQKLDTGGDAPLGAAGADTGAIATAVWSWGGLLTPAFRAVNATLILGDSGAASRLQQTFLTTQTNFPQVNLHQIRSDTGAADRFFRYTQKLDTGGDATVSASIDTGQVNQAVWQANAQRKLTVDTGIAEQVWKTTTASYNDDTGTFGELLRIPATASVDTGQVNQAVWQANAARSITNVGDTGIVNSLQIIRFDVDTGLRAQIADADTGIHDAIADLDTGIRALLALRDTGAIATAIWAGDTGLRDHITNVDTGITNRLNIIASDVDTGLRTNTAAIKAKTDSLTFTVAGVVDSNIQRVNDVAIQGTGDTGTADTWRPA